MKLLRLKNISKLYFGYEDIASNILKKNLPLIFLKLGHNPLNHSNSTRFSEKIIHLGELSCPVVAQKAKTDTLMHKDL